METVFLIRKNHPVVGHVYAVTVKDKQLAVSIDRDVVEGWEELLCNTAVDFQIVSRFALVDIPREFAYFFPPMEFSPHLENKYKDQQIEFQIFGKKDYSPAQRSYREPFVCWPIEP